MPDEHRTIDTLSVEQADDVGCHRLKAHLRSVRRLAVIPQVHQQDAPWLCALLAELRERTRPRVEVAAAPEQPVEHHQRRQGRTSSAADINGVQFRGR